MDDASHTSLVVSHHEGFLTGRFTGDEPRVRLALDMYRLVLYLLDSKEADIGSFDLQGKTIEDAISWIRTSVGKFTGIDVSGEYNLRHHDLNSHPVGKGDFFAIFNPDDFFEMGRWYVFADRILNQVRDQLKIVAPVRVWPHHFDIAILHEFGDGGIQAGAD
ncbi:MAG TPA: hypothetical protein VGB30_04755 [bacterium]|jgi:hypothetical protein